MRLIWPLLILFQISLAFGISLKPFNAAAGSFRREERAAALQAMSEHPSPETKAAMQTELNLNIEHITHQQLVGAGVWVIVFLVLDVACFYGWRNFKQNLVHKTPSA